MGWSSGTDLFIDVWKAVRMEIGPDRRVQVCRTVIEAFEQADWDTQNEAERKDWPEVTEALLQIHPKWRRDDD